MKSISVEERIFRQLFQELDTADAAGVGRKLAEKERAERGLTNVHSTVYGEVTFKSFAKILAYIEDLGGLANSGGKFCDIGSGIGKACFAAALLHGNDDFTTGFQECIGIELLSSLHCKAVEVYNGPWNNFSNRYHTKLTFKEGDLMNLKSNACDWFSSATLIFSNSTMFESDMLLHMALMTSNAPEGCYFVTFSLPLPTCEDNPMSVWELIDDCFLDMSWGGTTVYFHRRCICSSSP